ncbi:polysaccharide biosynthesis protein GumE [Cellvibrio sp. NN19]|uniref:polysaccharide biosynthesis protein GumE n=1 Tax=Cellvibrio chitinivorans TaxID=3102792 RepID=UPI002B4164FA|nr:polysaccharide biosynthesis protein GumE [Cellvibrio sp. NN19]
MNYSPKPQFASAPTASPVAPAPLQMAGARPWLSDERLACIIIVATVCYQGALCFINSTIMPLNRTLLGASEALILLICVPLLLRRVLPGVLMLGAISLALLSLIWLITQQVNIKSFRDLAMPLCYFWLGCNIGRTETADRAFKMAIWVVLIMGLFEALLLDYYTRWFDIYSYYVNMGAVNVGADIFVREDKLMSNGMRPEGIGRTLLPQLLGPHRVSSVFLEPIAMGNFATISAAWGLCRPASRWREGVFFVVAALIIMVLCDSRFALLTIALLILIRLLVHGALLNLFVLMPLLAIIGVLVIGATATNEAGHMVTSDDFKGRLSFSGWMLMEFDLPMLLGIKHTINFFDAGYAHTLNTFGLPLVLVLWLSFWLLPLKDPSAQRFRAMVSFYIALILCVSGTSFFALKTTGVLWFLVGCSLLSPAAALASTSSPQMTSSSPPNNRSMSHAD